MIALVQALLFLTLGIFEGTPWHHCPHHDGELILARMHASAHGRDAIRAIGMAGMIASRAAGAPGAAPAATDHSRQSDHDSDAPHRGCTCIGCSASGLLASRAPAAPAAAVADASPERPAGWTFPALRAGYLDLLPDSTAPPRVA